MSQQQGDIQEYIVAAHCEAESLRDKVHTNESSDGARELPHLGTHMPRNSEIGKCEIVFIQFRPYIHHIFRGLLGGINQ